MQESKLYNLFGKEYRPNSRLLAYNSARQFVRRKAVTGQAEFDERYKNFTDIEQVLQQGESAYFAIIERIAADCVQQFFNAGVSTYNVDSFLQFHNENFASLLAFPQIMNSLHEQYEVLFGGTPRYTADAVSGAVVGVAAGAANIANNITPEQMAALRNAGSAITGDENAEIDVATLGDAAIGAVRQVNPGLAAMTATSLGFATTLADNKVLAKASKKMGKKMAKKAVPFAVAGGAKVAAVVGSAAFLPAVAAVAGTALAIGVGIKVGKSIKKSRNKAEMFSNPELSPALSTALYNDCFSLHLSFAYLLQNTADNGMTEQGTVQAQRLFNQLNAAQQENELDTMIEILELYPYEPQYFTYLVDKFQDEQNEVEILAEDFGYLAEIQAYKTELSEIFAEKLPKSTIEETAESLAKMQEYCRRLGGVSLPAKFSEKMDDVSILAENYFLELAEIPKKEKKGELSEKERLKLLEKAAATITTYEKYAEITAKLQEYCEPMGDVPEVLAKAISEKLLECQIKSTDDFLQKLIEKSPKTLEELLAAEEKLLAYCSDIEVSEKNFEKIPAAAKIDKMIRTIEKIEFETREIALAAWSEKAAIEEILASCERLFRGDFLAVLSEINSGRFTTKIRDYYENLCSKQLKEFDDKLENAQNYEQQKNSGKKFTGLKNLIKDASSSLWGETAWKELTQNGRYDLAIIGSERTSAGENLAAEDLRVENSAAENSEIENFEIENVVVENPPVANVQEKPTSGGTTAVDIVEQLHKLNGLKEIGALTDEEFAVMKGKLLASV
ncbi:MAG: hypothetical protein FWG68_04365 [Defluviitaleaceae bacterium]|nr:hypothetical protein [Defluviitaleaceae bacterium]